LLARVFAEQFEVQASSAVATGQSTIVLPAGEKLAGSVTSQTQDTAPTESNTDLAQAGAVALGTPPIQANAAATGSAAAAQATPVATADQPGLEPKVQGQGAAPPAGPVIQPKAKKDLVSDRVQNPHDPEAIYSVKGQGENKKEHVGYKVQVAETVCEATLVTGEPTRNFIVGIVTHPAHQSDEAGALQMELEQTRMGLEKPPVQYVDGAYVSGQRLAEARAGGGELIGPAAGAPDNNQGRFTTERFQVQVEQRTAVCPAGHASTQCSRLVEAQSGRVNYRFEWSTHCVECPLRPQCVDPTQRHRTIVVTEHHSLLQARRLEQQTPAFRERMKHRNGVEGTQSELIRAHGMRQARYRGLSKVRLQNYFIGAACNVKRWFRREAWKLQQTLAPVAAAATASS
jgi:hypothetical protein